MKTIVLTLLFSVCCLVPASPRTHSVADLASRLASVDTFRADVDYEVLLPSSDDPVVYTIRLVSSSPAAGDSLCACNYLVEWQSRVAAGTAAGFNAYFNGNCYNYRNRLLREYHADTGPEAFSPAAGVSEGVQNQSGFAALLPQFIGRKLAEMAVDTTYVITVHPDTVVSGRTVLAVDGVRRYHDIEACRYVYLFDKTTLLPLYSELTNNPGGNGEQIVTAAYSAPSDEGALTLPDDETALAALYPEAFTRYRERDFSLGNLKGRRMPAFTAPTVTGERYAHASGDSFASPTVIAILDAASPSAGSVVRQLRDARKHIPHPLTLIFAFVNNSIDDIEAITLPIAEGEHHLMNARGLLRACRAESTPVVIVCSPDATVCNLIVGDNNSIEKIVTDSVSN